MTKEVSPEDQSKGTAATQDSSATASMLPGCFDEDDIKEGEKVLGDRRDQGMRSEGDPILRQGEDTFGDVLGEVEERLLWESMEDFILENPTPAYPPVLSSPAPTPRYIVLCIEIKKYINIAGLAKSTTRPAFLKGAMFSTLLIGTKLTKVKCLPEISFFMMASLSEDLINRANLDEASYRICRTFRSQVLNHSGPAGSLSQVQQAIG